jgi:hypothetical protein
MKWIQVRSRSNTESIRAGPLGRTVKNPSTFFQHFLQVDLLQKQFYLLEYNQYKNDNYKCSIDLFNQRNNAGQYEIVHDVIQYAINLLALVMFVKKYRSHPFKRSLPRHWIESSSIKHSPCNSIRTHASLKHSHQECHNGFFRGGQTSVCYLFMECIKQ